MSLQSRFLVSVISHQLSVLDLILDMFLKKLPYLVENSLSNAMKVHPN